MQNPAWSQLITTYEVADRDKAYAYESASDQERSCLKNGIAYHALSGEGLSCEHIIREHAAKGYRQQVQIKPAPWLVCLCASGYTSPARLIAALMPAIIAHVPQIFIIHLGKPAPAILVALELLGIENSIALVENPLPMAQDFLSHVINERGRVIILPDEGTDFTPLRKYLNGVNIPFWEDAKPPRIYAKSTANKELLNFTLPDAIFCNDLNLQVNAVYGLPDNLTDDLVESPFITQAWATDMEGCFVHDNLQRKFFQNSLLMAGCMPQESL